MQSQSEGVHIMVDFDAESEEDLVQLFSASAQLHQFALGERVVYMFAAVENKDLNCRGRPWRRPGETQGSTKCGKWTIPSWT